MFSKNKTTFLIWFLFTATTSAALAQEETGYRVEVLILRHLESAAEPQPVAELRNFAEALDLPDRARREGGAAERPADPLSLAPPVSQLLPPLGPFTDDGDPWADITLLENRSERMDGVWRNLRLSGAFRPEAFLAWEQPAEEPFPLLRIHNDVVVDTDDPFAAMRSDRWRAPEQGSESGVAKWRQHLFSYDPASGEFGLVPIPEPSYFYQVDGTVRLRRLRFLHVDLDLEFRVPGPGVLQGIPGPPLLPEYQGYRAHALEQSRQVRTGRMEYFDSPVLGALVWVTEIEWNDEGGHE